MSEGGQRIDKWLFFARLTKTRGLAQEIVASGAVRVNREKITHAARPVRPGDVLTVALHGRVRVLKVLMPALRRGPASEASTLYEDLSDPVGRPEPMDGAEQDSGPRPTSQERRDLIRLRRSDPM